MKLTLLILLASAITASANPFGPLLTAGVAAVSTNAITDQLISYWKMEEASGTRVDSETTGTAQNLTQNGGTISAATGKQGNAAHFVGPVYFTHADSADLSLGANQPFTVTAWIKPADLSNYRGIVAKVVSNDGTHDEFSLYTDITTGRVTFQVGNGTTFASVVASTFGNLTTGTWYFVAAVYDSVGQAIRVSVNAGSQNSTSWAGGTQDTAGTWFVGSLSAANYYWSGDIDEVGFWKRTLSTSEITTLYNSGSGMTLP